MVSFYGVYMDWLLTMCMSLLCCGQRVGGEGEGRRMEGGRGEWGVGWGRGLVPTLLPPPHNSGSITDTNIPGGRIALGVRLSSMISLSSGCVISIKS